MEPWSESGAECSQSGGRAATDGGGAAGVAGPGAFGGLNLDPVLSAGLVLRHNSARGVRTLSIR